MLIQRWQAATLPTLEQLKLILQAEGIEFKEEKIEPSFKIQEHRHPFGEVRIVVDGELVFNVGGTQLMLRAGDRIDIAANTKHSHFTQSIGALTLYGSKPF